MWPRETMPTKAFLQPARATAICTAPSHLCLFVSNEKGEKWSNQCQPRFFYSQPASVTAICMAPCAETRPLPPIPPFLLVQNLSLKQIAPSDNWRPSCMTSTHQWLKGFKGILFYYCNTLVGQVLFLFQFKGSVCTRV